MVARQISERLANLIAASGIPSRDTAQTELLTATCARSPSAIAIARTVWDHVENVLASSTLRHELPPPASDTERKDLADAVRRHLDCAVPELLDALLAVHNGILANKEPSAFYSVERIIAFIDLLTDVDRTLLIISGSISGNYAVLRLAPAASDFGYVYAFWHEDYEERGVELLARNLAEYLVLASESIFETIAGHYRGPTELPLEPIQG